MDLDPTVPPEIARWLWVLTDTRRRTLEALEGLDAAHLDVPAPGGNTIGTILAHIAVIEVDWLFVEIREEPYPDELLPLLPPAVRDAAGNLMPVPGTLLSQHLHTLDLTRARLLDTVRSLDLADLRRSRHLPDYDVTPEWVLHHLVQHEAEHRAEISVARTVLERMS